MKEQQIEKMAKTMCPNYGENKCRTLCAARKGCFVRSGAERLYNADYRKQSEGEWELHKDGSGTCSECHFTQKNVWDYDNWQNFAVIAARG